MGILDRASILAIDDLKREAVDVPEWGGSVIVRMLTAAERDKFEASMGIGEERNLDNIRARLVGLCAIDEQGGRLFPDDGSIAKLGGKSAAVLDRLFAVCKRINGIGVEAVEEALGN